MTAFFDLFFAYIYAILAKINIVVFEFYGYHVSLLTIAICFVIISLFVSILWRGAKY